MSNDTVHVTVWRGTNDAQGWDFKVLSTGAIFPLDNTEVRLEVSVDDEVIIDLNSVDDAHLDVDVLLGRVTWTPTIAESRLIPRGGIATYELERRIGGVERPLCSGQLIGVGGLNPDG